ncbi:hypothetical protein ILUMI_06642 [Ignelater luminosus]|uniref:Tc1-like transposase DDE domain-containing protein n=1 Tax=Ignelater luminosus TaxID=2038154 RepID=A0A8K0D811_IGNLU|nr:hypothetical protein ILUMI_06642 [Ignelater luminosus]
MVKAELLVPVKHVPIFHQRGVDELAKETNKSVLRLPPYHCELNPIELTWLQTKGYVTRNNVTFKLNDVTVLFKSVVELIMSENWKSAIGHMLNVEQEMWELDRILEIQVETLIINLQSREESSD